MDMAKLHDTATAAIERGNYDYAVTLLTDLLKMQPGHEEARKKLRETVVRKFQQAGKSPSAMAWLTGLPAVVKILIAQVTKKYDKVLIECENFLVNDPKNKVVLSWLAEAAARLELSNVAIDTYEWAHENHRKDPKIVYRLSQIYAADHNIPKATEFLELYRRIKPEDRDADRMLRDLAAEQTIDRGYGKEAKAGGSRGLMKDEEEAERLADQERIIRTEDEMQRGIRRAEKDVELDPKNRKALASLGQLYRRAKRHEDALKMYQRILELDPRNVEVQDAIGDIRHETLLREVELLAAEAKKPGAAPELAEQAAQKRGAADEAWGKELARRVAARPTDLHMRHIYGLFLFERERWDEALAQLQQSRRDPRHRRDAYHRMGQCFFHKSMYDMAAKQYAAAYEGVEIVDEQAKGILYNWAMAAEAANDNEEYEDKIRRIYENDVSFRDVGKRMEEVYKAARGET